MPISETSAVNTFAGTDGVTVTTANSIGPPGDGWNTVTIGTGATNAYSATHALHVATSNQLATGGTAASPYCAWNDATLDTYSTFYGRIYLYFTAVPAANHRIFTAVGGTTARANLQFTTTGKLRSADAAGATVQTTTTSVALNQWVRVEWMMTCSATVGQIEVKLFNTTESATPTETITSGATLNTGGVADTFRFGIGSSVASVGPYWQASAAIDPAGYPGPFDPYTQTLTDTIAVADTHAPEPGIPGLSVTFDGVDDYVEIADHNAWSIATTGELTVLGVIRPDSLRMAATEGSGYVYWVGKGTSSQQEWAFRMYQLGNTENRKNRCSCYAFNLTGGLGNGSYFQDDLVVGQWLMITGCWDATTVSIYKDGVLRDSDLLDQSATGGPTITPANGTAPLRIGTRDLGSYFQGGISRVAIWNRKLTGAEITGLQTARTGGTFDTAITGLSGLQGFWKLDEQVAGTTVAADSSGNGRPGTYHG